MNGLLPTVVVSGVLFLVNLTPAMAQNPVVVELFTSEGCSSCPPADAVLLDLSRHTQDSGTDLILLGEHVDYWNYIGWTDRFSSVQFSDRQSEYAKEFHLGSVYTPQMVIDGRVQFVGNDASEVQRKIQQEAQQPKPAQVSLKWEGKSRLNIKVQSPTVPHSKVLLAVTEDGLTTSVGSGENDGRTLHHAAVVRQLRDLGSVNKSVFETTVDVAQHSGWNPAQLKVAVLVQDSDTGKILGAAQAVYPQ